MIDLNGIQNIIFDFGNVILNLAPEKTLEEFKKLGHVALVEENPWDFQHEIFYSLEKGLVSVDEFHLEVRDILGHGISDEQIDYAWTAMLQDIPETRVNILLKLKEKYRTYLFSNTNAIHVQKFESDCLKTHGIELPSLFDKVFYSNEIKCRKPDIESFNKVIELSGIDAAKTIFIDDSQLNVEAAKKTGLQTFWLQPGMSMEEILTEYC